MEKDMKIGDKVIVKGACGSDSKFNGVRGIGTY